ncbi:hypothetical protein L0Z26_14040 [Burkholderia multivorans]|nr:hypothetical protein [Burkholderia multivorans]MCO1343017.1 hypothetical protein [Burkholderia multivorans]MCO1442944.1 hypothetical protein [Burkholderia multivorans]UQO29999.1 hypothetical protein L0Z21_06840 [Burkholderia multivorans]UQO43178.1 hypothetical protein L0Z43_07335 [Burkholderia multivorans]
MVEAGYPVVQIYEQHGEELGISYSQFARYVARYVRKLPRSADTP